MTTIPPTPSQSLMLADEIERLPGGRRLALVRDRLLLAEEQALVVAALRAYQPSAGGDTKNPLADKAWPFPTKPQQLRTPRTDAIWAHIQKHASYPGDADDLHDLAMDLERELVSARAAGEAHGYLEGVNAERAARSAIADTTIGQTPQFERVRWALANLLEGVNVRPGSTAEAEIRALDEAMSALADTPTSKGAE